MNKSKTAVIIVVLIICILLALFVNANLNSNRIKHVRHNNAKRLPIFHDFKIKIIKVEKTGSLSRRVYAEIINNGGDKKNVRLIFEMFVGKDRIDINGKKYIFMKLGNVKKNETIKKYINISVGFFDGIKIKAAGSVRAKLTILWDGGRQIFSKKISV